MSFVFPTNASQVQAFAGALYGVQVGSATMAQVNSDILANGGLTRTLNGYYSATFAKTADAAKAVATNLGLTGAALTEGTAYITAQLNAAAPDARGAVISNIVNLFGTYTADATFGAAATAWNTKLATAIAYTGATNAAVGTANAGGGGSIFQLTAGVDDIPGTAGNDTFNAITKDATPANGFTSLDKLDGGAGNDSLLLSFTGAVNTTTAVSTSVKNIETAAITATNTVTTDTTAWTGLTTLTTAGIAGNSTTAASTTAVTAVDSALAAGALSVLGGSSVLATATAQAAGTVTVGSVAAAPTGDVTVVSSGSHVAGADNTIGAISVTGGSSVSVTQTTGITASQIAAASTNANGVGAGAGNYKETLSAVTVQGTSATKSVTVTQDAAVDAKAYTAPSAGVYAVTGRIGVINGAVAVTDLNTVGRDDTISTLTLNNFGVSTFTGNALTTLNFTGAGVSTTNATPGSKTLEISQSAGNKTAAPTTLTINGSGATGVITDKGDQYTTINVVATGTSAVLGGLDFSNATSIAASGAGTTTISAATDLAKVTSITSTGGGLTYTPVLGNAVAFSGGAGKESISLGATTKAINLGDGDNTVTVSADFGTGGSVTVGSSVLDVLRGTGTALASLSASNAFEAKIAGFDRLTILTDGGTINLANLDDINYVTLPTTGGLTTVLQAVGNNATVIQGSVGSTSTTITLQNDTSSDTVNYTLSSEAGVTATTLVTTGFETVNITSTESVVSNPLNDTSAATVAVNTIGTLTDAEATTVVVTGNAGLTINTFTGIKVTSFDASAKTRGGVTYTTGALDAAATLKGGAGNDVFNAAAATKAITFSGGAGDDTFTSSISADSVDGGNGRDTYALSPGAVLDVAGVSAVTGSVINLGATALASSDIWTLASQYLAGSQATVAANSTANLFGGESSTNAVIIDTLTSIENATGNDGIDYIVGSAETNVLDGAAGVDYLSGGDGDDFLTGGAAGAVDTLIGGTGNDTLTMVGGDADIYVETTTGGTDTLLVTANGLSTAAIKSGATLAAGIANAAGAALIGIEQIVTTPGAGNTTILGAQITGQAIAIAETAVGATNLVVTAVAGGTTDLSKLTFTSPSYINSAGVLVSANALTSATDTITINGGAGAETIVGTSLNDIIASGAALDVLTGGAGADIFRFEAVAGTAAAANVKTITDFATTVDKINFGGAGGGAGAVIKGLTLNPAATTAAVFGANTADAANVATIADVYTALAANVAATGTFAAANFAASGAGALGIIAKTITFANGAAAGTYLVVNDNAAGFLAADDIVIKIVGTVVNTDLTFTV